MELIEELGKIYVDYYKAFRLCESEEVLALVRLPYENKMIAFEKELKSLDKSKKEDMKRFNDLNSDKSELKNFIDDKNAHIIIARRNWAKTEEQTKLLQRRREICSELWSKK